MTILSHLIYVPLQVLAIPGAIFDALLTAYKQILVSKRLEVSQTAIEIINGRWTMHVFGLRKDEAAAELISVLPNTSKLGLWLVLWPLWVQARVAGQSLLYPRIPSAGDETIADMVPARTTYFDAIIARAIKEVDQFVLLGAGNSPNQRLSAVFQSSLFRSPTIGYRRYSLFLHDEHSTFWIMPYKA